MGHLVIWLIHFYQKHASPELRSSCLFIPTCSDYMILAIQKYGVLRGVYKGIRRILRCKPPNGGYDYP